MSRRIEIDDLPRQMVSDLSVKLGANWFEQKWDWSCAIEGERWFIEVSRAGGNPAESYQAGSDGETTYTVNHVTVARPGSNDSTAVVENGVMPYESALPVHPVWLAFCAPRLLDFFPSNTMPALAAMGASDCLEARTARYAFRAEAEPGSEWLLHFELLNDGYIREKLNDGRFIVARRDPPYDSGFPMIRLSSMAFQVSGGARIPAEVKYERLKPSGKTINTVTPVDHWEIVVTSSCPTNFGSLFWLPKPTAVTDVKDRRFAQSSPPVFSIEYRLKDGHWLKRDDGFLLAQYEAMAGVEQTGKPSPKTVQRFALIAFVGLSTIALCFLLRKKTLGDELAH